MPLSEKISSSNSFSVYCICGGFGFPAGTASTKRIRLIGRGLVLKGIPFHVWHIGPSPFKENIERTGIIEGISFEYLSPGVSWPSFKAVRTLYYLWGFIKLIFCLLHVRKKGIVYCYYQGDIKNLVTLLLCRLMRIPVVQEVCEWWPGTPSGNVYNKWMYRNIMFRWSTGGLVISHEIRNRIESIAGTKYTICMMPVLVDPAENKVIRNENHCRHLSISSFLWCGMVDGYKKDVLFLIDAMAQLKSQRGQDSLLRIIGPCSQNARDELLCYAASKNISAARLDIAGFVSEDELWEYCTKADALLMPLWDDDRSITRFPTKLGQYLAAGRPIVTSKVGEIKYYLNEKTAMFYRPGDAEGLTQCLDRLLDDTNFGDRIAGAALEDVLPKIDFRTNAERISEWFHQIYLGAKYD
jgi:glycosyltransferase involved in cell wall biosynthesis